MVDHLDEIKFRVAVELRQMGSRGLVNHVEVAILGQNAPVESPRCTHGGRLVPLRPLLAALSVSGRTSPRSETDHELTQAGHT
jgi:hypothetical protein